MLKNTANSYGSIAKFFHWFIAITLLCLFISGYNLENLGIATLRKAHKALGFIVLLMVVARLLWRFSNITPVYESSMQKWMILSAHSMHYMLYALMIIVPLAGFIASNAGQYPVSFLFLFDMPSLFVSKNPELSKDSMFIHKQAALIFVYAIGAHILAALYHHYIKKDGILKRMIPFINKY
jgi:cytochrome b561